MHIPLCITFSLQNLLFSLRLNKENTDDLPVLRVPMGDPYDLPARNWHTSLQKSVKQSCIWKINKYMYVCMCVCIIYIYIYILIIKAKSWHKEINWSNQSGGSEPIKNELILKIYMNRGLRWEHVPHRQCHSKGSKNAQLHIIIIHRDDMPGIFFYQFYWIDSNHTRRNQKEETRNNQLVWRLWGRNFAIVELILVVNLSIVQASNYASKFYFYFIFITEEPSMAKPLKLSIGTQTSGC